MHSSLVPELPSNVYATLQMDPHSYDEEPLVRLGGIPHERLGNFCNLCTDSLLRFEGDEAPNEEESKGIAKLLFHGTCSNEKDKHGAQELLCDFCRHLRLNHLLRCLKNGKLRCSIRFCEFKDIEKRQSCPFCHLLIRSAMPYAYFSGMATRADFEGGFLEMIVEGRGSSWSWSSTRWDNLLLDDSNRRQIRYCGPLVVWYSCQQIEDGLKVESIVPHSAPDFQCSLCKNGNEPAGTTRDGRYKDEQLLFIAIAWGQGCIESDHPFKLLRKTSLSSFKAAIASKWPCIHTSWQFQSLKNKPSSESLSYTVSMQPKLEPTTIFTRAQSAFFRLNLPTAQEFLLRDYPILDDDGTVGVLVGQEPDLQAELLGHVEAGEYFEFIALSVSAFDGIILPDATTSFGNFEYRDPKQHLRENESLRELTYLDKKGTPLLPIPVVNAMLIRRTGSTARRVGIAWIYLKKWVKARPQFGDVFLE